MRSALVCSRARRSHWFLEYVGFRQRLSPKYHARLASGLRQNVFGILGAVAGLVRFAREGRDDANRTAVPRVVTEKRLGRRTRNPLDVAHWGSTDLCVGALCVHRAADPMAHSVCVRRARAQGAFGLRRGSTPRALQRVQDDLRRVDKASRRGS